MSPKKGAGGGKVRATFNVSEELLERCRDAVYQVPGLTMTSLAEAALEAELGRLERSEGPFTRRRGRRIPRGRPAGRKATD